MHIDHRCHFEFWQGVVVEIALNHAAVFDIDSAVQGAAQAVDYGTLYLGLDDGRIDRLTAVDYAGDPVDPGSAAFVDGDFRDLGLVAGQGSRCTPYLDSVLQATYPPIRMFALHDPAPGVLAGCPGAVLAAG